MIKVRDELNNHKDDPNGIILRLHAWGSDADNERQIVRDYRDYFSFNYSRNKRKIRV